MPCKRIEPLGPMTVPPGTANSEGSTRHSRKKIGSSGGSHWFAARQRCARGEKIEQWTVDSDGAILVARSNAGSRGAAEARRPEGRSSPLRGEMVLVVGSAALGNAWKILWRAQRNTEASLYNTIRNYSNDKGLGVFINMLNTAKVKICSNCSKPRTRHGHHFQ